MKKFVTVAALGLGLSFGIAACGKDACEELKEQCCAELEGDAKSTCESAYDATSKIPGGNDVCQASLDEGGCEE